MALLEDIITLDVEAITQIWRDGKIMVVGIKRAKILFEAEKRNIGSRDGQKGCKVRIFRNI